MQMVGKSDKYSSVGEMSPGCYRKYTKAYSVHTETIFTVYHGYIPSDVVIKLCLC